MRIYLVEDVENVRDQIQALLTQIEGVEVVGMAATAGDAIAGVRTLMPDIVVLDLGLKSGAGQDVLRELGTLLAQIRVVVFSNSVDEVTVSRCLQLGAVAVLDKSTQVDQLYDLILALHNPKTIV